MYTKYIQKIINTQNNNFIQVIRINLKFVAPGSIMHSVTQYVMNLLIPSV